MLKYKKFLIFGLIILLALILFWDNIPFSNSNNGAEKAATNFIEYMLEGDAESCVDLMSDDVIESSGYDTKKLFTHALDKKLDLIIDTYKNKYGKRWRYKIIVIDSYEHEIFEDYTVVVLEIQHKGSGLFKDKDGSEEVELILECVRDEWIVCDYPYS